MPETKRALKVFLCHASADKPAVRDLYKRLTADGVDAWLDAENLIPGQNWQVEIPKAIRESDVVIVCLSEKSVNKEGYVQKEIKFALDIADEKPEGTIFIVPARLEECKVPDRLSMYHWVDLFEPNGYTKLMGALRLRSDSIGATLQVKKGWLPKIPSPPSTSPKVSPVNKHPVVHENKDGLSDEQEKVEKEKLQQEVDKRAKDIKRSLKREIFISRLRSKLNLFLLYFRHYIFPAILLLGAVVGVLYLGKPFFDRTLFPTQNIKMTETFATQPSQIVIETIAPSATIHPSLTPTEAVTSTATLLPTEITDAKGVSMVLVPAGEFTLGYDEKLFLDDFYIDKYEVTNLSYSDCVDLDVCPSPSSVDSFSRDNYYGLDLYDSYPVININWEDAETYCEWRGTRLPSDAEWEKAARGPDGRRYPWSAEVDSVSDICSLANVNTCVGDTTKVGSYEDGKSIYGVYDLYGNVWEWTKEKSLRGLSWYYYPYSEVIIKTRDNDADIIGTNVGFRCASSAFSDTQPTLIETTVGETESTPLPTEITDTKGVPMVFVPEGEFLMGIEDGGIFKDAPSHSVYLVSYYIDKYEVTNKLYKTCVDAGRCEPPQKITSGIRGSYYGNSIYDDFPVIYVDWYMAKDYCEWRETILPSEAQWEKAARGTDGRVFPWQKSESSDDCLLARYSACGADTVAVGSYEKGKSPYGAYDMVGNVREWVSDWYSDTYYGISPYENPTGPQTGDYRVLRGSGWDGVGEPWDWLLPVYERFSAYPSNVDYYTGFRCARDITQ